MEILIIINELVEILFLILGLFLLLKPLHCSVKRGYLISINILTITIWMISCMCLRNHAEIFLLLRFLILAIYALVVYKGIFFESMFKCFALLVCVDAFNFVFALITYPVILMFGINEKHVGAVAMTLIIDAVAYGITLFVIKNRKPIFLWNIIGAAKNGMFIICVVIEVVFVGLKTANYNQNNITIYLLWIAFIVFGITILTLWLRDRKKQHDKFSELIKYEHRTREIIPAIEKALQDLKNMGLTKAGEQRMIAELEAICKSDRSCLRGRNRQVRSFETTGSPILDNQLEQFVEECEENGILLDVIVRAEITAFLDLEDVEILTVLQIVGDLYRNAFKAVSKNKEKKNLLICFGYNANDYYEIGIYDNGHPFPSQIKEQLGVRGVTVDGTGHGMADVFEHLHRHQASFVLEENPAKGFTFTKGIHIVFDEKDRMEILS